MIAKMVSTPDPHPIRVVIPIIVKLRGDTG
jgi:hypothetical protein